VQQRLRTIKSGRASIQGFKRGLMMRFPREYLNLMDLMNLLNLLGSKYPVQQ
jgi:hypothetical protein